MFFLGNAKQRFLPWPSMGPGAGACFSSCFKQFVFPLIPGCYGKYVPDTFCVQLDFPCLLALASVDFVEEKMGRVWRARQIKRQSGG